MKNPLHAQALPLQGRQLPPGWEKQAEVNRRLFDEELRHKIENQWRNPQWSNKLNNGGAIHNITRASMLSSGKRPEENQ